MTQLCIYKYSWQNENAVTAKLKQSLHHIIAFEQWHHLMSNMYAIIQCSHVLDSKGLNNTVRSLTTQCLCNEVKGSQDDKPGDELEDERRSLV